MVRRMTSWSALSSSLIIRISSVLGPGQEHPPLRGLSSSVMKSGSSLASIRLRASATLLSETFEVSDGHVVAGQGGDPSVAQGIEIWRR